MTSKTEVPMMQIDTSSPVLVTGGTGYVAGVLIQQLLEAGVMVHATVRNVQAKERYQHLVDLKNGSTHLRFFSADLVKEGSFEEAMQGCSIVFHTASPFILDVEDPQTQLLQPAIEGTRNVLRSVNKTASVKRVVLTSSTAACFTDATDTSPDNIITEASWNQTASLDYQPYYASKAQAEQVAWEMSKESPWSLVVINPGLVVGPGVKFSPTSESFGIVSQLAGGAALPGLPNFALHLVDVRDVALAHIKAAYLPSAQGRHIICADASSSMWKLSRLIKNTYPSRFPLPRWCMPVWIIWLLAPYFWVTPRLTRPYVAKNQDQTIYLDNTKSKTALGLVYRPMQETIDDMMEQIIQSNGIQYHVFAYMFCLIMGTSCIRLFLGDFNLQVKKVKQV